jgi:hypothetical protein
MPFDKLYIKIKCTMCDGTRLFKFNGHHIPSEPFKWKSCPYCDPHGLQLIEASQNAIAEFFAQLDPARYEALLHNISQKYLQQMAHEDE